MDFPSVRFRAAKEEDGKAKLLLILDQTSARNVGTITWLSERAGKYEFARLFEGEEESGVHRKIEEIITGKTIANKLPDGTFDVVRPLMAILEISLDGYNRIRRGGGEGGDPFPPFERLGSEGDKHG